MTDSTSASSALVSVSPPPPADITAGVFSGIAAFEAAQRMAQALCTSTMVPTEYRGQQGLSNSLIALEIAARMGLSPLVVMQNMTPIHGKPSWSSSFLIATVNASGRFTPLRFVFDDKDNPTCCYAIARDKATGEVLEGQTISIAMAKQEGWWSRPDRQGRETSKWQSMTGQMLRYRAAAFWVKVYCPEISLGLPTQDEVSDVQAVEVRSLEPATPAVATPVVPEPGVIGAAASERAVERLPEAEDPSSPAAGELPSGDTERPTPPRRPSRRGTAESAPNANTLSPTHSAPDPGASMTPAPASELLPVDSQAMEPGSASPLIAAAQQEIPKLITPEALEQARVRVNRLLADGQLQDGQAEQLWDLIDRRLQQIQLSPAQDMEPEGAH